MNKPRFPILAAAAAVLALFAFGLGAASAADEEEEAPDYVWNAMQGEKLMALRAKGDPVRGAITFEICQGCHRAHALGRPDGSYPRLAGQHDTVLIKQMTDVRAGRRRNDKMLPFVDRHVIGPQDIADIATYLTKLPVPPTQGKGPGQGLEKAAGQYRDLCQDCHGKRGEGDAGQFYPRVSGQHFRYLRRELIDIRDGARRNANPRMVKVVRDLGDADLEALADYMSRLPVDGGN